MNLSKNEVLTIEVAINMLDEIVESCRKGCPYPFSLKRTKEVAEDLILILKEGD